MCSRRLSRPPQNGPVYVDHAEHMCIRKYMSYIVSRVRGRILSGHIDCIYAGEVVDHLHSMALVFYLSGRSTMREM
jgi:hypothetical protein